MLDLLWVSCFPFDMHCFQTSQLEMKCKRSFSVMFFLEVEALLQAAHAGVWEEFNCVWNVLHSACPIFLGTAS